MIAAVALFTIKGVFLKAASVLVPVSRILIFIGFGGTVIFASVILVMIYSAQKSQDCHLLIFCIST